MQKCFRVLYVDYGNRCTMDSASLRPLPPELASVPACALRMSLANVCPIKGNKWDEAAIVFFVGLNGFNLPLVAEKKGHRRTGLEDHLNPKPYLGYLFETYVDNMKAQKTDEFSVADEAVMRESCIRFITTLVDQIRQRLPDNITVLQKTSLLSVENALCVVKEPLIPLLEAMAVPPETIEKIRNQWGKITLLDWKQISSTQSFWCEVHSYKDACGENPFAELAGFAMSMLVLPYSNAEVERTFSQLNIVKSKLRNKLKPETTNAILVVRAGLKRHQKSCFDYDLPAAVVGAIGTSATYVQPSHLSGPSTSTSGPVEIVSDDNSGDEDLDVFFVDL
ncbi:hypothetical protein MRX96_008971 [Rhipicephalus microplus]